MPREIDGREEKVADFGACVRGVSFVECGLDLVRLLTDLGEHGARIVPVEADIAGLVLQLERAGEGGKGGWHPRQRTRPRLLAAFGALLGLDPLPQALHRV